MAIIAGRTLGTLALCLGLGTSQAEQPVKALDERGCLLSVSNGKETLTQSTLDFVASHYDEPGIRRDVLLQIAQTALTAGCPANADADAAGMTPLNAAILFNRPELVALLLTYGADPKRPIVRPGKASNGWNSYQLQAFLKRQRPADRSAIDQLLDDHRSRPAQR